MKFTTFALIIILGNINALLVLAGVALGGFLVYRTKREPHEGLFVTPGKPKSAVAQDEHGEQATTFSGPDEGDDEELSMGADVSKMNSRFLDLYNGQHPTFVGPQPGEQNSEESTEEGNT